MVKKQSDNLSERIVKELQSCVIYNHMVFGGILTSILTLTWHSIILLLLGVLLVYWRFDAADTESNGLLTDSYLTLHIFKVLYFVRELFKLRLCLNSKSLFIRSSCLSVPWWFLFSFFNSEIILIFSSFHLFYIIFVRVKFPSSLPWNLFAVTLYAVILKINLLTIICSCALITHRMLTILKRLTAVWSHKIWLRLFAISHTPYFFLRQ